MNSLPIILDGKPVEKITAFLFSKGGNENPHVLLANADKSFLGSCIMGMGFTFDNTNPEATPISEMDHLIEKDQRNQECVFPYIGGEEVNSSPTHAYHRYVINFGEMSEEEAQRYPDLITIVEKKVKPKRLLDKREVYRRKWWQHAEKRVGLWKAIATCDRVLAVARVGQHGSFTFLPTEMVYSEQLVVFALPNYSAFCTLQSRVHEIWARFFGSSLEDRLRYTPSDCFETFPFPHPHPPTPSPIKGEGGQEDGGFGLREDGEEGVRSSFSGSPLPFVGEGLGVRGTLETIGKTYYEFRAHLMERNNQGLTDTYNRFHDPDETDPDILKLRELHTQMDRAVLDAYGWQDIPIDCQFLLDYEEDPLTPNPSPTGGEGRQRKKPWRYRWPEEIHDEVLARLLVLNQERHEAEILGGKRAEKKSKAKGTTSKKGGNGKNKKASDEPTIPGFPPSI
jgi:hypothetical protein